MEKKKAVQGDWEGGGRCNFRGSAQGRLSGESGVGDKLTGGE